MNDSELTAGFYGPHAGGVPALPSLGEATRVWFKIGCLSFGGPAGQIALLHREVVDDRKWVSDRRFLHALNFCHLLPGPEAQQLAIYLGWLMHGPVGGFSAGLLFVIPGALVMLMLSLIYATLGTVPVIAALFYGLKSAVLLLVVEAVLRIGRRALKGRTAWALAGASFAALFLFNVPFPIVVLVAGLIGLIVPSYFAGGAHGKAKDGPPALLDAVLAADPGRADRLARGARYAGLLSGVLWLLPVALLLAVGGLYGDVAWFFSKMAVMTFGGAYAVLAYAAQEAVQGRMGAQQMVVQGSHLKALGKQLAHHRIDFAFREDEVAHHHGLVPHRLEGHPAAEGEARFEGHSIKRNVEVAAGQPIAMDVARDGSRPGQDRVDNEPVRLRRLRRHGQGDAKRDRGERKKAVHVGSFRVDRPRRIHAGFPGLLVGQLCVSSLASRAQR